jgi:UPF0755 protein
MKKLLFSGLFIFALLLAAVLLWFYLFSTTPYIGEQAPVSIVIAAGSSLRQVSAELHSRDVIISPGMFEALARIKGNARSIKFGTYEFSEALSPLDVLDRLQRGLVRLQPFTVPEGRTLFETARIIAATGLANEKELLKKTTDPDFIDHLDLSGNSLEGFLFPDTYFFSRAATAASILEKMVERYRQVFAEEVKLAKQPSQLNEQKVITLASLVEAETGKADERPLIAGVFLLRLKKGMRLECDPTVVYGQLLLDPSFNKRLRRRHLLKDTPYNTYRNYGLPPGPICSPGRLAIRAVLQPVETDFLFFVSRNDGSHKFSRTLREHNRAVNTYQRARKTRKR